mmetsp:Transcript_19920/g.26335  ORF Transcript_19920/g.26335 Transcript_19920/m.26335 type:complete len:84 (-) Transcript_19920:716-967(-)
MFPRPPLSLDPNGSEEQHRTASPHTRSPKHIELRNKSITAAIICHQVLFSFFSKKNKKKRKIDSRMKTESHENSAQNTVLALK